MMGQSCSSMQPVNYLPSLCGMGLEGTEVCGAFPRAPGVLLPSSIHKQLVIRHTWYLFPESKRKHELSDTHGSSPHTQGRVSPSITSHPCSTICKLLEDRHNLTGALIPVSVTAMMQYQTWSRA